MCLCVRAKYGDESCLGEVGYSNIFNVCVCVCYGVLSEKVYVYVYYYYLLLLYIMMFRTFFYYYYL